MSIIGIDIGSSTTKMIEYKNEKIVNKKIFRKVYEKSDLYEFIKLYNIKEIEKIVFTGIGSDKVNNKEYDVPVCTVEEFKAIAEGGKYLSNKDEIIVTSVGTGTALIEVNGNNIKHLGGTGVGAGMLLNLCKRFLDIQSFDGIYDLASKGDLSKIDLRIGDITTKEITTLPLDLTLANFGKFEENARKEDIVLGFVNMVFEVIGMMVAFSTINSDIKEAVLIGNITVLPGVQEIMKKIEFTHKVKFIVPEDVEYGVVLGAVISSEK